MRISDWSSDVCSSVLLGGAFLALAIEFGEFVGGDEIDRAEALAFGDQPVVLRRFLRGIADARAVEPDFLRQQGRRAFKAFARDRQSVVEGQSVSVRVGLGGSRNHKKKNINTLR